uniref:Uncharacterized protein n=1 Tax=Cyanophora sudae TaxID=1522369 RepID=A0A2Z4HG05_9EUKA|nr:hypothetical protein [Cyanophora sudae]AWW13719.1 hypothetical protein [Cyanophora sudae]
MCICVNCDLLTVCSVYQTIENLHCVSSANAKNSIFEPRKSQIAININSSSGNIKHEWDVIFCDSFVLNINTYSEQ